MDLIAKAADQQIPRSENKQLVTYDTGTTNDIVKEVLSVYKKCKRDVAVFAQNFKSGSVKRTAELIWTFVKKNIRYSEDPAGVQWIKTPARIWQDKECDCKGYSIFIGSILYNLGIDFAFRFTGYSHTSKLFTHVYIIAYDEQKKEIFIDDVMPEFNKEKLFVFKKDYQMTQISRLSGIGCPHPKRVFRPRINSKIGNLPSVSIPVNAQGNTTDELISKSLLLEQLMIEKAINEENKVSGIGAVRDSNMYDAAMQKIQQDISSNLDVISGISGNHEVTGLFKKLGNAVKKVAKGAAKVVKKVAKVAVKVATFPLTLPNKLIFEIMLPKAADNFLYIFIYPEYQGEKKIELESKVNDKVRKKAKTQKKIFNLIKLVTGFKDSHMTNKIRNGILKKYKEVPEVYLAKKLGIAISGIGWVAAVAAVAKPLMDIVKKLISLFKKKGDSVTEQEVNESTPTEDDWSYLTEDDTPPAPTPATQNAVTQAASATALDKVLEAGSLLAEGAQNVTQSLPQYQYSEASGTPQTTAETIEYDDAPQAANNASPGGSGNNNMLLIGGAAIAALLLLKK